MVGGDPPDIARKNIGEYMFQEHKHQGKGTSASNDFYTWSLLDSNNPDQIH